MRTKSIKLAIDKFLTMTDKEIPDSFSLPSLSAGYWKTGDTLYMPSGYITVEKTLNDISTCFRTVGAQLEMCHFPIVT